MTDRGENSIQAKRRELLEKTLRDRRARQSAPNGRAGHPSLLPLRPSGSRPPLFLVHAVGGSAAPYMPLAQRLGPEQPVYGLESPGLYGDGQPADQIGVLAASYAGLVRQVRPQGPYLIGGWSIGGVIAVELALGLRAAGQETPLLVLLDVGVPPPFEQLPDQVELLDDFVQDIAAIASAPAPRPDLAVLRGLPPAEQLETVIGALEQAGLVPGSVRAEVRRRFAIFTANAHAFLRYRPAPFDVPVTLIEAADSPVALEPQWRPFARAGLTHYRTPGAHHTMLAPPHLDELAATMRRCLDLAATAR